MKTILSLLIASSIGLSACAPKNGAVDVKTLGAEDIPEQQLVQAAKLAAVGELASNVAHELNNPLTSVLG